ncbi:MAG: DnaJ domain-containing protein [Planctomycetes bacterium]|nr:DnaJ domain-containing protein [Planctomycetota bacterium]
MSIMRQSVEGLYKIFDLLPSCPDEDFRQAYRRVILTKHPDKNLGDIEGSTERTQEINAAYDLLKKYRENPESLPPETGVDIGNGVKFSITFDLGFFLNTKDIAQKKDAFQRALSEFSENPRDTLSALRLIHASFMAERYMEFRGLLEQSLLIDPSAILLQLEKRDEAVQTLLRWADYLNDNGRAEQALQIVEDAFKDGERSENIRERLRNYHYRFAQGYHLGEKRKPAPPIRITHLSRILALGFELDYVHKLLAEAYYESGDRDQALAHLQKARAINPDFSGGVKISRALGLLPQPVKQKRTRQRQEYAFTKPEQIPHPNQIRSWADEGKWEQILSLADLTSYSPKMIPSARSTIRQIAASLGDCPDKKALEFLRALKTSIYWDVRKAVESSLARWGKGSIPQVADKSDDHKGPDILRRLWDMLVFETYHPGNDDHYVTAFTHLGNRVLNSIAPEDILGALHEMTRWLELIGEREMTTWIRELIRREAPGTWYVDPPHRDRYIQNVKMSNKLKLKLAPLLEMIRSQAPNKLAQALGSKRTLGGAISKSKARTLPN